MKKKKVSKPFKNFFFFLQCTQVRTAQQQRAPLKETRMLMQVLQVLVKMTWSTRGGGENSLPHTKWSLPVPGPPIWDLRSPRHISKDDRPDPQAPSEFLPASTTLSSPATRSHPAHICTILVALRKAGLVANAWKCCPSLEEVEYLDYNIGRGLVKPKTRKVESIVNWPCTVTTLLCPGCTSPCSDAVSAAQRREVDLRGRPDVPISITDLLLVTLDFNRSFNLQTGV